MFPILHYEIVTNKVCYIFSHYIQFLLEFLFQNYKISKPKLTYPGAEEKCIDSSAERQKTNAGGAPGPLVSVTAPLVSVTFEHQSSTVFTFNHVAFMMATMSGSVHKGIMEWFPWTIYNIYTILCMYLESRYPNDSKSPGLSCQTEYSVVQIGS